MWWFLPYISMNQPRIYMCPPNMNQPRIYMCPPHRHLPPYPVPVGCPRAPTFGTLLNASNLHWPSILHVVMYIKERKKVKSLRHVRLFATPWTVAYQAPPSTGFSGKNTRVGCHFLLLEIFLTQGLNPGLPHCRQTLYRLSHKITSKL